MSWAIWITGPPGSGKSTLARAVAAALAPRGVPVRVLELDAIRKVLTPAPTYDAAEREVVYRALVQMATLLTESGVPVILDATGHRRAWRDLARAAIPRFAEVQLRCPPGVCREREGSRPPGHAPRGIYARAGRPGATVPGVDVTYEEARAPELTVDTARETISAAAARIVALAERLAGHPAGGGAPDATRAGRPPLAGEGPDVRVRDLIGRAPVTVTADTPLFEALQRMQNERVHHLLVTREDGRLVGILSDRDARVPLGAFRVGDVMAKPVVTVGPDESPGRAAAVMLHHGINALPVVEGRRLVGIVTARDLLRAFAAREDRAAALR